MPKLLSHALQEDCLFVKRYRSHKGPVSALEVSHTGDLCASMCMDGTLKVYDVSTFDMIVMLRLKFVPGSCAFISSKRASQSMLAVSDLNTASVHVFDISSGSEEPIRVLESLHQEPITCMRLSYDAKSVRFLNNLYHLQSVV